MQGQQSTNLWVKVARDLQNRIRAGEYPVGSLLPTELELCEMYGLSRYTVRAALRALQGHGLVSRRKNAGTRVEATSSAMLFGTSPTSVEELAQYGSEHLRSLRSTDQVKANRLLAKLLQCDAGTSWIHFGLIRMWDGSLDEPLSWIDVYVDPAFADIVHDVEKNPGVLTSTLLERRYRVQIKTIDQRISAIACSDAMAKKIGVLPKSPALQIVRRYIDVSDAVLEVSVTTFPATRYTHTTYLHRTGST